jgi:hypothetical protein
MSEVMGKILLRNIKRSPKFLVGTNNEIQPDLAEWVWGNPDLRTMTRHLFPGTADAGSII